jgi:hypothetical protein
MGRISDFFDLIGIFLARFFARFAMQSWEGQNGD